MYTLCNEDDNCYARSVNWRASKGIFLQLAPDVAGTVCICRACGEEYNEGFIPVNTPKIASFPSLPCKLSNTGGEKGLGMRLPQGWCKGDDNWNN